MKIRLALIVAAFLLVGCAPKPDAALVLWEQPAPQIAAEAHAREIRGMAFLVQPTGSMEPFISGGDWITVDVGASFDAIRPGDVLLYQARWLPPGVPMSCHMAAARSGDGWVMDGIANAHYENGYRSMLRADFRGKVVRVYTKRARL